MSIEGAAANQGREAPRALHERRIRISRGELCAAGRRGVRRPATVDGEQAAVANLPCGGVRRGGFPEMVRGSTVRV